VTGSSRRAFVKGKSCLTKPLAFCDELTVDKGRVVNVLSLNLGMAFDALPHNIFIGKLMKHGLDR